MKIERIREELGKARRKAAERQARAKDLERQLTEQENLEIIQAVRSITVAPEELGDILVRIRSMKLCAGTLAETVPGAALTPQEPQGNAARVAEMPQEPQSNMAKAEIPQKPQNNLIVEETGKHEE